MILKSLPVEEIKLYAHELRADPIRRKHMYKFCRGLKI